MDIRNRDGIVLITLSQDTLVRADLGGADLWGADLWGADLRGAHLRGADLGGAHLRGADLRGADLRDADLADADLRGAHLRGADLRGADLGGADLGGAILPTGERWEDYLRLVVPTLIQAGGKSLEGVRDAWRCHEWENCPMAYAFGVTREQDCPILLRPRVTQFVQLFDAGLIPCPVP